MTPTPKPDTPSPAGDEPAESLRYMKARTVEARKMGLAEARGNYISVACAFESNRKELVRATAELARLRAALGDLLDHMFDNMTDSNQCDVCGSEWEAGDEDDHADSCPFPAARAALATNTTQGGREDDSDVG